MTLIERAEDLAARCIPPASGLVREMCEEIKAQQRELAVYHSALSFAVRVFVVSDDVMDFESEAEKTVIRFLLQAIERIELKHKKEASA